MKIYLKIEKGLILALRQKNPWNGDKLDRKKFIENFYNIITSTDFPFVYSLEGGFGTGKTQCCKILESYIEQQEKEKCVYFNVWENDFYDNPFHFFPYPITSFAINSACFRTVSVASSCMSGG